MKYIATQTISLLEALSQLSPQSSKTTLKEWLSEGRILLDGEIIRRVNYTLHPQQILTLGPKVRYLEGGIRLLYEDDDLLVIEKPEGLLSVSTDFEHTQTAFALVKKAFRSRQVHVVHRLDQETSGVMCFALSERGKIALKDLFAAHDLLREYVGIVEGHLDESNGTWSCYLYEDDFYRMHVTEDPTKGQLAITHFLVEKTSKRYSRLRLRLETGRKNQIRIQCKTAGHSIVGDKKYGAKGNPIKRMALHAERLEFVHPISHKKLKFFAPAPEKFKRLVM